MNATKVIVNPNLQLFIEELIQHVKDGWEVTAQMPPTLVGYWYEVHVERDESIVDEPKLSRAEILANARAAKKAKAEAEAAAAEAEVAVEPEPAAEPEAAPE